MTGVTHDVLDVDPHFCAVDQQIQGSFRPTGCGKNRQPASAPSSGETANSGTVLLVEDEAEVRATAAEHLRDLGYTVPKAVDLPAALRILQDSRGSRPDLLMTDVGLPNGLNGRQVAEAAREQWPSLPVLLITGHAGTAFDSQLGPGTKRACKPVVFITLPRRAAYSRLPSARGTPASILRTVTRRPQR